MKRLMRKIAKTPSQYLEPFVSIVISLRSPATGAPAYFDTSRRTRADAVLDPSDLPG
jgi:hypothetical protein